VLDNGGVYEQPIVEKVNAPNLGYKDPVDRSRFGRDYEFILQCLRYTRAEPANDPGDVGRPTLQRSTG
jgi:hypothetical protein